MDPGLCSKCERARKLVSARGSEFWRCSVADLDPRWPKYPRLPVLRCEHFQSSQV